MDKLNCKDKLKCQYKKNVRTNDIITFTFTIYNYIYNLNCKLEKVAIVTWDRLGLGPVKTHTYFSTEHLHFNNSVLNNYI